MIEEIVKRLKRAKLEPWPEELADALWLASLGFFPVYAPTPVSDELPPPETPELPSAPPGETPEPENEQEPIEPEPLSGGNETSPDDQAQVSAPGGSAADVAPGRS